MTRIITLSLALLTSTSAFAAVGFDKSVDVTVDEHAFDFADVDIDIKKGIQLDLSDIVVVTDLSTDTATVVLTDSGSLSATAFATAGSGYASAGFSGYAHSTGGSASISASAFSYVGDSGSYASASGSVSSGGTSLSVDVSDAFDKDTTLELDLSDIDIDLSDFEYVDIVTVDFGDEIDIGDYVFEVE